MIYLGNKIGIQKEQNSSCSHKIRSIKPTWVTLLDPTGAETLRKNREKLSRDITELINEYGPKVFPDFDGIHFLLLHVYFPHKLSSYFIANYISRTTTVPSRTTSTSSLSWTTNKLPRIASGFFQQQAIMMNWLDDKTIFNWGRITEDDAFSFWDFNRSRSGSISETDSRSHSRRSSFSSSSNSSIVEGFKIEGLTSTLNNMLHEKNKDNRMTTRRIFRIDDEYEQDLGNLTVSEPVVI